MSAEPMLQVQQLIELWCNRREYVPLAIVLPAWTSNNGLTDGWETLHDALKHAYAMCRDLPDAERDALKSAYIAIEVALRNRD
jgi:hypothetical protein